MGGPILALDPSIRCTGWVLAGWKGALRAGVIETQRETKKRRIYAGDDDARRVQELHQALFRVLSGAVGTQFAHPEVWAEQPAGSQSYRGAKCEGLVLGWLASRYTRIHWVQARDVKRALAGKATASKADMVVAAEEYDEFRPLIEGRTKARREAIADACGVLLCSGWRAMVAVD